MSKIYEGETKLSVSQVCDKVADSLTQEQAQILYENRAIMEACDDAHIVLSHAILNAYKLLPADCACDIEMKKMLKFLMEKFMKSTTLTDADKRQYQHVIDKINERRKE
jgi:hypothetical protein